MTKIYPKLMDPHLTCVDLTSPGVVRRVCLARSHAVFTGRTGYTRVEHTPSTNSLILTFKIRVHPRPECSFPYARPTSRLDARPKHRRTRSHSRPKSTPMTSKTVAFQSTVTIQHNPSRIHAGDAVTGYRYILSVHTPKTDETYLGIYKLIYQVHAQKSLAKTPCTVRSA